MHAGELNFMILMNYGKEGRLRPYDEIVSAPMTRGLRRHPHGGNPNVLNIINHLNSIGITVNIDPEFPQDIFAVDPDSQQVYLVSLSTLKKENITL
jgi:hypothetical protein